MEDPRLRTTPVLCSSTRDSTGCGHPVDDHTGGNSPRQSCSCCSWTKCAQGHQEPVRTSPPAGISPEKWSTMPRRERRALMKGTGRGR